MIILGPMPATTADFWQMIWDQNCLVIAMTTDVEEEGIAKCHQYWERSAGDSIVYANFMIETTLVESNEGYTVSTLEVKNLKVFQHLKC